MRAHTDDVLPIQHITDCTDGVGSRRKASGRLFDEDRPSISTAGGAIATPRALRPETEEPTNLKGVSATPMEPYRFVWR